MIKQLPLLFIFLFLNTGESIGQDRLVLEHKTRIHKKKFLKSNREYTIETTDSVYVSKIISFTDTTLSVTSTRRIPKMREKPLRFHGRDTTSMLIDSYIAQTYTTSIPFRTILRIRNPWFGRGWTEFFDGAISFAICEVIIATPVAAIAGGAKAFKTYLLFDAAVIGVCVPIIYIGTRHTNYSLGNTWILKSKNIK